MSEVERVTINLYPPLTRAITAEARRTLRPRGQLIAEVIARAWPEYVRDRLNEDLNIVDAQVLVSEDEGVEDEDIPALTA